jgi:hypothetical protein
VPLSLALPTIDAPCDTRSPTAHRPLPCPRCARRRAALATQPARAPCSRAFRAKRWTSYSPSCAYKMEPHSLTCTHLATPLTLPTAARHCGSQGEPPLRGITAPPEFSHDSIQPHRTRLLPRESFPFTGVPAAAAATTVCHRPSSLKLP